MKVLWVQLAATWIMVSAAAIAIRFRLALPGTPKPQRSKHEPAWLPNLIAGSAALLAAATIWGIVDPKSLTLPPQVPPFIPQIAGVLLGVIGSSLMYYSLIALGPNFSSTSGTYNDHRLTISGPYRYVRHPYYTATSFIIGGLALLLGSLAVLLFGILLWVCLALRARAEECELLEKFGLEFEEWKSTTGTFLPRIRR